jgi:hypothetical protein
MRGTGPGAARRGASLPRRLVLVSATWLAGRSAAWTNPAPGGGHSGLADEVNISLGVCWSRSHNSLSDLYSQIRYTVPYKNEFRQKHKAGRLKRIVLRWFNLASSSDTLCGAGFFEPLPLPVLSSRPPPQLQSCAELIQVLLSSVSGAAFLLAGANSSGAGRRCCASSSLSRSITASSRPEKQTEVSQPIRERRGAERLDFCCYPVGRHAPSATRWTLMGSSRRNTSILAFSASSSRTHSSNRPAAAARSEPVTARAASARMPSVRAAGAIVRRHRLSRQMRRSTRGYKAGNGGGGGGAAVCVLLLGWPCILAGQQVEAGRARAERWE